MRSALVIVIVLVLAVPTTLAQKAVSNAQPKQDLTAAVAELERLLSEVQKSHEALSRLNGELTRHIDQLAEQTNGEIAKLDPRSSPRTAAAIKRLQDAQMSFNMQYLGLQQKMQDENRRFTMLSNIMKTKHDTVKNSISNIR